MRNDADFAAYVVARWPFLVRSLVLIGCPRGEAEELVVAGVARCHASWEKVRESEDVDVHVYRAVLDRWHHSHVDRRTPFVAEDDAVDELLVRQAVEAELWRLPPGHHEALVLRYVAELSEDQVGDVLEGSWSTEPNGSTEQDFRIARETIDVPPAPYDAVVERVARLRRRRRRVSVAAVSATVLVLAGVAWVSTRPAPGPEPGPQPRVVEAQNPIDLPWYGAGRLQLRNVAVELPEVSQLVEAGGGAVYVARDGALYFVGQTGRVTALGETPIGSPVVASDERGWVAWVTAGDDAELVVQDVTGGREVARVEVLPGARPVALDQNLVFFLSEGRTHVWEPLTDRVEDIGARPLLDVEAAVRVYGDGARIDIVQPFFSVDYVRPGTTAELSPGGTYVLSRRAGQLGPFRPVLYDARSGERLPTGLNRGELVLDAAFGPDGTIEYLVVRNFDQSLPVLRSCDLVTAECANIVPLRRAEVEPRLAH